MKEVKKLKGKILSILVVAVLATSLILAACAPPELGVTMGDLIKGVIPFVLLIMVALGLCTIFPDIILWLPGQMIR